MSDVLSAKRDVAIRSSDDLDWAPDVDRCCLIKNMQPAGSMFAGWFGWRCAI